jgi:hypothetical protein
MDHNRDEQTVPQSMSMATAVEVVDGVTYRYMTGFQNQFVTEVLPGAVPVGRNTPRTVPYNLYTEQISGTAFITVHEPTFVVVSDTTKCHKWCNRITSIGAITEVLRSLQSS